MDKFQTKLNATVEYYYSKPLFTKRRIQHGSITTDGQATDTSSLSMDASGGQDRRNNDPRIISRTRPPTLRQPGLPAVPETQALTTNRADPVVNYDILMDSNTVSNTINSEQTDLAQSPWSLSASSTPTAQVSNVKSALTAMINLRRSVVNNPLAAEYASVGGTGIDVIPLKIWLPHSDEPNKPMSICVKKDASVEDVVGYVLYQYVDQKRQPSLEGKLSIIFWNMRIVEDDGEIDEDLPALERGRQIQKFDFGEFALCQATAEQVKTNEQALRLHKPSKAELIVPMINTNAYGHTGAGNKNTLTVDTTNTAAGHALQTKASNVSLRPPGTPSDAGPQRDLMIHLHNTLIGYHTTSISVQLNVPFADVLVDICRRWKLEPREYALKFLDTKTDVPSETTLEQLPDLTELALMKKGSRASGEFAFSTPSDHHRISRAKPKINITNGLPFMYQRFTVTRRMPMLVGRHERILAIDGEYIHIMPPENRNMFDKMKTTSSYHISSVLSCKQHGKISTKFKLVVYRDRDVKTYDFDGATEEDAVEICARINFLMRLHRGESPSAAAINPAVGGKGAPANVVHANSGFMLVQREDASYDFQWF
ncbi:stress-activated map kinase interacting protein 1-domain-containing protein [Syncephalis fuscata]|nr:stress-activated map kinase interacting protein 1-domain-containing protein [Syncephalis fuscata]